MRRADIGRLDSIVVSRGLADSREKAQALIMAGSVTVNGQVRDKPGQRYREGDIIELRGPALRYVGRGGLKLEAALDRFAISCADRIALDVGASTGGFTDCLLQRGARKVFAVDVGYGQLHQRLRDDPRVVVIERLNARYITRESVPEEPSIITMDVSFISVTRVLPAVISLASPDADFVILIKPQFEAGPQSTRKGVVRDPAVHMDVLVSTMQWCAPNGLRVIGLTFSPIKGPEGNIEFLLHAATARTKPTGPSADPLELSSEALAQATKHFASSHDPAGGYR